MCSSSEKLHCWKQCGHQSCHDLVIDLVNKPVNDLVNVIFLGDFLILLAVKKPRTHNEESQDQNLPIYLKALSKSKQILSKQNPDFQGV